MDESGCEDGFLNVYCSERTVDVIHTRVHLGFFAFFFIAMTQVQEAQLRKTKLKTTCIQGNVYSCVSVDIQYGALWEISVTLDYICLLPPVVFCFIPMTKRY